MDSRSGGTRFESRPGQWLSWLNSFADFSQLLQENVAAVSRLYDDGSVHIPTNSSSISDPPHWGCIFSLLTPLRATSHTHTEGATGVFRFITTEICASNEIFIFLQHAVICAVHLSRMSAEQRLNKGRLNSWKTREMFRTKREIHPSTCQMKWSCVFTRETGSCPNSLNWYTESRLIMIRVQTLLGVLWRVGSQDVSNYVVEHAQLLTSIQKGCNSSRHTKDYTVSPEMKITEFCDTKLHGVICHKTVIIFFVLERRGCGRGSRGQGGGREKILALKFHRQCPLVLLVGVCWREGKAMGSGPC
jgi:hypothetical protein